jgi:hypothetical protein
MTLVLKFKKYLAINRQIILKIILRTASAGTTVVSVSAVTRCGINYLSFGGMSMKTADESTCSSAAKL